MITIKTKRMKLADIKTNPDNPRTITEKDMSRMVKSLSDFPEMSELREIIIDEDAIILGGNMRHKALRTMGIEEVVVKIVTGLTANQKQEFMIKDNAQFGLFDMDILANMFSDLPLIDWGVGIWDFEEDDPNEEWEGMPEFEQEDKTSFKIIHVYFKDQEGFNSFSQIIGQKITEKTRSIWYPEAKISRMDEVYENES